MPHRNLVVRACRGASWAKIVRFNPTERPMIDDQNRSRTETAPRPSRESYDKLLDGLPVGIQRIDTKGAILYSNRAHHKMLGYPMGELIGKSIHELMADPEWTAAFDDVILHDPDHAFETALVAAIDRFLVESSLAGLERCVAIQIPGKGAAAHHPVVVPHRPIGVDDGEPALRVVYDGGKFVDQSIRLLRVEEEVADFPCSIPCRDIQYAVP